MYKLIQQTKSTQLLCTICNKEEGFSEVKPKKKIKTVKGFFFFYIIHSTKIFIFFKFIPDVFFSIGFFILFNSSKLHLLNLEKRCLFFCKEMKSQKVSYSIWENKINCITNDWSEREKKIEKKIVFPYENSLEGLNVLFLKTMKWKDKLWGWISV